MTEVTEVVFRKFEDNIYAIFPYEIDWDGNSLCYVNSNFKACHYSYLITHSKPVQKEEYRQMFDELTNMGYDLKLIKKRDFKFYISACKNSKPHIKFN